MATRSAIGYIRPDGSIRAVYCHWDGYPAGVGKILREHYTDPKKVAKLLKLGELSALGPEIGRKHSVASKRRDWTMAYHRDRGDELRPAAKYPSKVDFYRQEAGNFDYLYLFDESTGTWLYSGKRNDFAPLTEIACQEG